MTIHPLSPLAGAMATVAVVGCPNGNKIMLSVIGDGPTDEVGSIPGGPAVTTARWTYQFAFPSAVVGPAHLLGSCVDPTTGKTPFAFDPLALVVHTDRRLSVLPAASVSPGTTLTISAHGPGCDRVSSVEIELSRSGSDVPVAPTITGNQQAQWQATVALPTDLLPGAYTLTASCAYSRSTTARYPAVTFTVVGRPT